MTAALVDRCRAGDAAAWDELVSRYSAVVWKVARSHRLASADCEEVFQLTWLRVVEHIAALREPDRIGAWITTTARRESLRQLARARRQVACGAGDDVVDLAPHRSEPSDPAAGLYAAERREALDAALDTLGERDRRLITTLYADPAPSYDQVSATLAMPRGSIGPLRARALRRLAAVMPDGAALIA